MSLDHSFCSLDLFIVAIWSLHLHPLLPCSGEEEVVGKGKTVTSWVSSIHRVVPRSPTQRLQLISYWPLQLHDYSKLQERQRNIIFTCVCGNLKKINKQDYVSRKKKKKREWILGKQLALSSISCSTFVLLQSFYNIILSNHFLV